MSSTQGRLKYLMNDFVVQEHVCNLRCTYCLNFENENLKPGEPWRPETRVTLKPGASGRERAERVLEAVGEQGDAPLLRIAGGEVMALPGAVDFIAAVAPHWERVQVLTNAAFLTRDVDRLSEIPNLNLCCSLDGHTAELNALRTPKTSLAETIVAGVAAAVERGIPVEIYTVLTGHNAAALHDFARWVRDLPRRADVRLFPFPVRGDAAKVALPVAADFDPVERLIEEHADFAEILPPVGYLHRLLEIGRTGKRRHRCRIPLSILQSFDDGVLAACTNCWAAPLGNVLDDGEAAFGQIGRANIHKLFLREPPRVPFCDGCFTPFDIVNVFFDGDCTLEEMTAIDLYSSAGVRDRLVALRDLWRDRDRRIALRDGGAETTAPAGAANGEAVTHA